MTINTKSWSNLLFLYRAFVDMIPLDCHENLAAGVVIAQISTACWRLGSAFSGVSRSSGRAGGWSRKSTSEAEERGRVRSC